eukprot:TRINITY_DN6557_c0_g1_i1.p1 TRINITY_DN6557_c0_g1~~TRINITY_DN6557_c0_g1_i1.p1  ORF type:complete len:275 (+),score=33.21 TRINITY_DN6557_c0_g1_i1:63-827(+)
MDRYGGPPPPPKGGKKGGGDRGRPAGGKGSKGGSYPPGLMGGPNQGGGHYDDRYGNPPPPQGPPQRHYNGGGGGDRYEPYPAYDRGYDAPPPPPRDYPSHHGGKGGKGSKGGKGGKGEPQSLHPDDYGVQHGDPRYQWTDDKLFNPFDKIDHPITGEVGGQPEGESAASVHARNLPPHADRLWLYSLFSPFGAVNSVRCQRDYETGRCVGWGLVKYHFNADAQSAIQILNGFKIDGRTIQVEPSNRNEQRDRDH